MSFALEKLLVYQKFVDFADHVAALTENFPRGYAFLAYQLNRAALSIAANIAEACPERSRGAMGALRRPTARTSSESRAAVSRSACRCWSLAGGAGCSMRPRMPASRTTWKRSPRCSAA